MLTFPNLVETILDEMAVSFQSPEKKVQTSQAIDARVQKLADDKEPTLYPKPLVVISNPEDRRKAILAVIDRVFGNGLTNPDIDTKKQLQDAIAKAVVEVSADKISGFPKPIKGIAAGYLGKWLGTAIDQEVEYSGASVPNKKMAQKVVAKAVAPAAPVQNKPETPPTAKPTAAVDTQEAPDTKLFDQTLLVAEDDVPRIQEVIAKINKKAARIGVSPAVLRVLGHKMVSSNPEVQYAPLKKVAEIKLEIPELRIAGWEFIAKVDHENGYNLIHKVPSATDADDLHSLFGEGLPTCDHCNKKRPRLSTFVVRSTENKQMMRIGRNCLKQYLPGGEKSARQAIAYFQFLSDWALGIRSFSDGGEGGGDPDMWGGGGGGTDPKKAYYDLNFVLGLTNAIVNRFGYVSNSKIRQQQQEGSQNITSTSTDVLYFLSRDWQRDLVGKIDLSEKDRQWKEFYEGVENKRDSYVETGKSILEWAKSYVKAQYENPNNTMRDYFQNLILMLNDKDELVKGKNIGYVVSVVPAYTRAQGEIKPATVADKKEALVSEYVGTVGMPIGELNATDRRKLKKAGIEASGFPYDGPIETTVQNKITFDRDSYSRYDTGISVLIQLQDEKGNVYVWSTTRDPFNDDEQWKGMTLTIKRANVKRHKEYLNKRTGQVVKQTVINRPTFVEWEQQSVAPENQPF